jgi:hypothetical protein
VNVEGIEVGTAVRSSKRRNGRRVVNISVGIAVAIRSRFVEDSIESLRGDVSRINAHYPNAMQSGSTSVVAICIVPRRTAVGVGSPHGCLDALMPWPPLPQQRAALWGKVMPRAQGNTHGLQRELIERRDACKGVCRRVRSQRGIMLLGRGLDRRVMKPLSRRRLLLCCRVCGASITSTRAGAMND